MGKLALNRDLIFLTIFDILERDIQVFLCFNFIDFGSNYSNYHQEFPGMPL